MTPDSAANPAGGWRQTATRSAACQQMIVSSREQNASNSEGGRCGAGYRQPHSLRESTRRRGTIFGRAWRADVRVVLGLSPPR